MNEEMIEDIENRIKMVVNRYRQTTGRDTYRLKYKFIYDGSILTNPFLITLWITITLAAIITTPNVGIKLLNIGMLLMLPILLLMTGKIKRVKVWKTDTVSEADLLYLSENEFLQERTLLILGDKEAIITYTNLDENITRLTRAARACMESQKRDKLIQKVKDVEPTIK